MADDIVLNAGSGGDTTAAEDIAGVKYQKVKLIVPTAASTSPVGVGNGTAATAIRVALPTDGTGVVGLNAGTNNIGDVDVLTVPADPFGANADAASATGSISAKLRYLDSVIPTALGANGGFKIEGVASGTAVPISAASLPSHPVTNAGTFATQAEPTATTAGGLSTMNASSSDGSTALTSTAQAIKASAGNLYGYYIYNPNAAAVFVQFYNTASGSVTVGTTTPLFMLTIPAASAANLAFTVAITFGTAMSWAATSTAGGNGAPTTALDAVCWYK